MLVAPKHVPLKITVLLFPFKAFVFQPLSVLHCPHPNGASFLHIWFIDIVTRLVFLLAASLPSFTHQINLPKTFLLSSLSYVQNFQCTPLCTV